MLVALLLDSLIALPLAAADRNPSRAAPPASQNAAVWRHGLSKEQQALLLLDRITFGPRPGDLQRVLKMGLNNFLNQQLHPEGIDDAAVESRLSSFPTLSMTTAELMEKYPPPKQFQKKQLLAASRRDSQSANPGAMAAPSQKEMTAQSAMAAQGEMAAPSSQDGALQVRPVAADQRVPGPRQVVTELARSELLRAVYSNRQLQEVMVQFWMNHFNIFAFKGPDKWMLTSFEQDTIRPRALGNFEDLLVATAESPAMLFYLDNWMSAAPEVRQRPQARMMPALFPARRAMFQRPSAFPGGRQRNKSRRPMGINENYGRELMELHTLGVNGGYTQQDVIEVARCFTGWTIRAPRRGGGFHFNPRWHDDGPKVVLGYKIPAGQGMQDGLEVLHILANHPSTAHFIALELCRRFVSDNPPSDLVDRASQTFLRTHGDIPSVLKTIFVSPEFNSQGAFEAKVKTPFELVASSLRALDAETNASPHLLQFMAQMGEPMFRYQPPSGYPDRASTWISSGTLLARMNFALALALGRVHGTTIDLAATGSQDPSESLGETLDELSLRLTGEKLAPEIRRTILERTEDLGGAAGNAQVRPRQLALMTSLVLASPQFQRR